MSIELKVPPVGESITEVQIGAWLKSEGSSISKDENLVTLESEKATLELPAPAGPDVLSVTRRWTAEELGAELAERFHSLARRAAEPAAFTPVLTAWGVKR